MYSYREGNNIVLSVLVIMMTTALMAASLPQLVMAQSNNTQESSQIDSTGFHSNIEQIIGHIEKAVFNKINNNDTLTLGHSLHPIEEVLTLVTIPITNVNSNLNQTYFDSLYQLSSLASPGNSTVEEFENQSDSSIALSNQIILTVVPKDILNRAEHNVSVIKDLLTISGSEYAEGVQEGKIVMELEYQDGSAFMDRAYALFNATQGATALNDTESETQIISGFSNLTSSVEQLKDPVEIDSIIQNINNNLSAEGTSTTTNTTRTSQDYVSTIRGLLDQVITAYESNDLVKAKELATTAYLDNFEFIERPIGEELSERGEALLREKLREQIDTNVPLEEIKQNIADINKVLDESETVLNSTP